MHWTVSACSFPRDLLKLWSNRFYLHVTAYCQSYKMLRENNIDSKSLLTLYSLRAYVSTKYTAPSFEVWHEMIIISLVATVDCCSLGTCSLYSVFGLLFAYGDTKKISNSGLVIQHFRLLTIRGGSYGQVLSCPILIFNTAVQIPFEFF